MATSRIADSVGRVLGGRYRLTRPLGVGASAHVYVAEDVTLRRRVAIKVLHPALAADEAFLRRFRAEAQAVASLRHPNILTVFDWGEDRGAPYLVTELLEGGSLRSMLDTGALLSSAQAARVGSDGARALDYAHRRGIVHRDIKPANLIFDDEGHVRVADFGLARALAEATWTEPAGAVVGTARYAAPEQARGEKLDSRADVYSLALVIVESMTGTVPFASDTTLGTLMARIGRSLQAPPRTGLLGPILEAAGTVDVDDRLDAGEFAKRLDNVSALLPPPTSLPLAHPFANGELDEDTWAPTELPGRRSLSGPDGVESETDQLDRNGEQRSAGGPEVGVTGLPAMVAVHEIAGGPRPPAMNPGSPDNSVAPRPPADPRPVEGNGQPEADGQLEADGQPEADGLGRRPHRRRRALIFTLVGLVILIAAGVGYGLTKGRFAAPPTHPVPSLVGMPSTQARARLQFLRFEMWVESSQYDGHRTGTVLTQDPSSGTLREGSTVGVVLSLGPRPVPVPDVAGKPADVAEQQIRDLGLVVGRQASATSMTVPSGSVISSSPDKGTLLPGQTVNLTISKGKPFVPVPPASTSATYLEYKAALRAVGLASTEVLLYNNTVGSGRVITTSPLPGTSVVVGTDVVVDVSRGPHLVSVPNVSSMSVGAATQMLASYGFQVTEVLGNPISTVTGSHPLAGTIVLYGSPVVLVTG